MEKNKENKLKASPITEESKGIGEEKKRLKLVRLTNRITTLILIVSLEHLLVFKETHLKNIKDWISQYEWASQING